MSSKQAVVGLVSDTMQAEDAVDALRKGGFSHCDISALFPERSVGDTASQTNDARPSERVMGGANVGGTIGSTLGMLVGLGALAIPGIGPFIVAGPILAALGNVALGGGLGAIAGALVGLGVAEIDAHSYEEKVKAGRLLISVHVDDDEASGRAKKILELFGVTDIVVSGRPPQPVAACTTM